MYVQVLLCLCGLAAAQHRVNFNRLVDSELKSLGKFMKYMDVDPLRMYESDLESIAQKYGGELEGVTADSMEIHGLSSLQRGGDILMWTTEEGELHSTTSLRLKNLTAHVRNLKRPGQDAKSMSLEILDLTTNIQEEFSLTDTTCKRNVVLELLPVSRARATDLDKDVTIDFTEALNEKLQTKWKSLLESEEFKKAMRTRGVCGKLGMAEAEETALSDRRRSNKFNLNPLVDRGLEAINTMLKLKDLQTIPFGDVTEGTMTLQNMRMGDVSSLERRGDTWLRTLPDNEIELKLGMGLSRLEIKVDDMEDEGTMTGPMSMFMRGPALMVLVRFKITDNIQVDDLNLQLERVNRATLYRQGKGSDVTEIFNRQMSKINQALQGELGTRINQLLRDNSLGDIESAEIEKILDKYLASDEQK